ncbi:hypothetical protein P280DRAFT_309633 [Massarina eburnea CBS 473.64]|uniref:Uncharacterized protein n=1 Tax=Massarina eburnea CBS 473.64 TaxID=1395130 RepID=A0A6A6S1A9_9PLEO|nr:hypothetical protein P280DRAFT_309633 [Massarina eburnea CBS 473.64]
MSSASVTHIFNKTDYSKHHLITLPITLSPLTSTSLLLRTRIIGLTTNNLTYARMGHILGWHTTYPLPANTPVPFGDTSTYARIAAWGHAEIVDSTAPDIPIGATVYGYLPISTELWTITVENTGMKNQIYATDEHRQHLWKMYNRYCIQPSLVELEKEKGGDSLGWDALMEELYGTCYNMNKYAFAWEEGNRANPSGSGDWSAEDANLDDAIIVVLNASGKTGMSWAYCLRRNRPKQRQPKTIIGVGSSASETILEESNFYDKVLLNSDASVAKSFIEECKPRRVVLFDFGAREGATESWRTTLSTSTVPFTFVKVGSEVKAQCPDITASRLLQTHPHIQANAGSMKEKGIALGGDKYWTDYYAAWEEFKKSGAIPSITLEWGEGIQGWEKGWEAFCRDKVEAGKGLVYRI